MSEQLLIKEAFEAIKFAYVPYSNFKVGAALLSKSGKVYHGCNIESASYTPTICAERTAFSKAVSEGETQFDAICIIGGKKGNIENFTYPCGVCRQVMMEFCDPATFKIIIAKSLTEYQTYTLAQLLPFGFGPSDLK